MLQHAETILPMAGEIQADLNCHTGGVSDSHAWGHVTLQFARQPNYILFGCRSQVPWIVSTHGWPMGIRQLCVWRPSLADLLACGC